MTNILVHSNFAQLYFDAQTTTSWSFYPQKLICLIQGQSSTTLLDTIYVFGGLHVLSRSTRRSEVYALGPDSDEWLLIGNMNMARSRAVVVNFGYQLFIIGGCDGGCAAELFTPAISRFQ